MEVKVDTTRAMRGGMSGLTSTPDMGKNMPQASCENIRNITTKRSPLSNEFLPHWISAKYFGLPHRAN
jgi:hypothetical protein